MAITNNASAALSASVAENAAAEAKSYAQKAIQTEDFSNKAEVAATVAVISSQNAEASAAVAASASATAFEESRQAIDDAIRQAGYTPIDSFEEGATLELISSALRWVENSNTFYSWRGEFPKTIPPSSTPETTGGFGENAWVDVTDLTLRTSLAASTGTDLNGFGKSTLTASITRTLEYFGAAGDGITDDTIAVRDAMNWVSAESNRHLSSGSGVGYRTSATIIADFSGNVECSIILKSPIIPDDNIGTALKVLNTRDSVFFFSVHGGGVSSSFTPNYALADPQGAQQAFVFQGVRSCDINVRGFNYKGRLLRTMLEQSGQHKTSANSIMIYTGENGESCGQALYAEGSSNWGTIREWYSNWDDYGSVLYEVEDVSILHLEAGWAKNNGLILAGVGSLHGVVLNIGNEDPSSDIKSVWVKKSASGKQCRRLVMLDLLIAGPYDGLYIENDGMASSDIASYMKITTSNSRRYGVYANNSRDTKFIHGSTGDFIPVRYSGNSYGTTYELNSATSRLQAIQIDSDTLSATFSGHIFSSGFALTGSPCIACDSVSNNIRFNSMHIQTLASVNNTGAYKLVANNGVRITGGKIERDNPAVTPIFVSNIMPLRAFDVIGFVNRGSGATFIPAGATFVDVFHGMSVRPTTVSLTRSANFTAPIRVDLIANDTSFKVTVDAAMGADAYFYWSADALHS